MDGGGAEGICKGGLNKGGEIACMSAGGDGGVHGESGQDGIISAQTNMFCALQFCSITTPFKIA